MTRFHIEIYDRLEGVHRTTICARDFFDADQEASILAAELGMRDVTEIVVYAAED